MEKTYTPINFLNIKAIADNIEKNNSKCSRFDIVNTALELFRNNINFEEAMHKFVRMSVRYEEPMIWDIMSSISKDIYDDDHYFLRIKYRYSCDAKFVRDDKVSITYLPFGSINKMFSDKPPSKKFIEYIEKKYRHKFSLEKIKQIFNIEDFSCMVNTEIRNNVLKSHYKEFISHFFNKNAIDGTEYKQQIIDYACRLSGIDESEYVFTFNEAKFFQNVIPIIGDDYEKFEFFYEMIMSNKKIYFNLLHNPSTSFCCDYINKWIEHFDNISGLSKEDSTFSTIEEKYKKKYEQLLTDKIDEIQKHHEKILDSTINELEEHHRKVMDVGITELENKYNEILCSKISEVGRSYTELLESMQLEMKIQKAKHEEEINELHKHYKGILNEILELTKTNY